MRPAAKAALDAVEAAYTAVCRCGVSDLPSAHRDEALRDLGRASRMVVCGIDEQRKADTARQEAEILKAWREGRVTITA